jgi:hypothetical protein
MRRWWIGCCLGLLLCAVAVGHADEPWREGERRGFPFSSERWEGTREWKPDRELRRPWDWPDRVIIDRPGKCEVRCERSGRNYKCREYRC